jgi:hypothetical protein
MASARLKQDMAANEQAVIDAFNSFLIEKARSLGRHCESLALGGQDRYAGADYLLTSSTRLALIEFKYQQADLASEARKSRRERLCRLLEENRVMREYHDSCHFICWSNSTTGLIDLGVYRQEVCPRLLHGANASRGSGALQPANRLRADEFVDQFLSVESRSLGIDEFESYLSWVMSETSKSPVSTLELLVRNRDVSSCAVIRFSSVREAYQWLGSR